jgi:hypothetical protein
MSSIKWLWEEIKKSNCTFDEVEKLVHRAEEIHRNEIIDASIHTVQYNENLTLEAGLLIAKKYYQDTFGSKGSSEIELTYEERVRWFVNHYYETGMEYASMLQSMKNEDLDNFEWYGEKVEIPKFYTGVVNQNTEEQTTDDNLDKLAEKTFKGDDATTFDQR